MKFIKYSFWTLSAICRAIAILGVSYLILQPESQAQIISVILCGAIGKVLWGEYVKLDTDDMLDSVSGKR